MPPEPIGLTAPAVAVSYLTDRAVALFVSLALGHLIGRLRVGQVALRGVCSALVVAPAAASRKG